ncbi:MAG TPA: DUF488 domain-containing protein [Pyrinomonadaceae bacterium]|nr:DUF488 domain-containing protein [Pyrinomonadaceae bacterium]
MKTYTEKTLYERALKRWENEGGGILPIGSPHRSDDAIKIWTIGHSTRELAEFLELLALNRIEAVADVRSYPGSRKFPQFNAEALKNSLPANNITYVPFKQLGGRRRSRPDSPNTVWHNEAFRGYADYMETVEFRVGVDVLLELARKKRTAIMCAEAVWWRCHRSMISDYLKAAGITVEHIMDGGKNTIHPFTSAARIDNGKLVYGAAESI